MAYSVGRNKDRIVSLDFLYVDKKIESLFLHR
jgi:hypothetical protein